MENIIMTEGIANQFKGHLQKSYDFLERCDDNIDKCKLLTELGIPNNNNDLKLTSYIQKGNINTLLDNVTISEAAIIDLDNKHSTKLDEIADTKDGDILQEKDIITPVTANAPIQNDSSIQTTDDEELILDKGNNSSSTSSGNTTNTNSSSTSSDTTNTNSSSISVVDTPPTSSNDTNDNTIIDTTDNTINNTNNEITHLEFSTKIPDMESAGDIFANSEYSLTAYTNYLLYKYNINDEEIAKEIYTAIINYGKEYANNNNGLNPIEKQDENSIILGIYNILKDKENFDINKYLIFKNIDVTKE